MDQNFIALPQGCGWRCEAAGWGQKRQTEQGEGEGLGTRRGGSALSSPEPHCSAMWGEDTIGPQNQREYLRGHSMWQMGQSQGNTVTI